MLALPLSQLALWQAQMDRIVDEIQKSKD